MPRLNITTNESSGGGGLPTGTGTAFVAGTADAGPPPSGPSYVLCQSLTEFTNAFGPRSNTSAELYDWLEEFFNEGGTTGKSAYVTRVTDSTATTASLTLHDGQGSPAATVVVSALTPGTEGNETEVTVTAANGTTFTANTTSSSPNLANVSSFKAIGPGTPVTGTGIPTGTYIVSVNTGAGTAVLSQNATATATGVTLTPGQITVTVVALDSSGDQIADETHGPYYTSAQLIADTTSDWVTFTQASGGGTSTNLPAALGTTSLTGGADANDLTDTSYVNALANFPASLGCGTVALPGRTSVTAWQGIRDHCNSTSNGIINRWGVLDMVDESTSAQVKSQVSNLPSGDWSRTFFIEGSLTLGGINGGPSRTVSGSSAVAALAAQVALTNNQAQAPFGQRWPLTYCQGFTEFFGPGGNFTQQDVDAMEAAGVNCFANFYGTPCLFGFVSPDTTDLIFDQATAARERMAIVSDFQKEMALYLADPINLPTITSLQGVLNGVLMSHYNAGALYDGGSGNSSDAFEVITGSPVNTPSTAQAKQLNADADVRIVRYADDVNVQVTTIPVSVSLPGASS